VLQQLTFVNALQQRGTQSVERLDPRERVQQLDQVARPVRECTSRSHTYRAPTHHMDCARRRLVGNQLSGPLPSSIGNLASVVELYASTTTLLLLFGREREWLTA